MAHVYRNRATDQAEAEPRKGEAYEKVTHLTDEQAADLLAGKTTFKELDPSPENKEQDVTAENKEAAPVTEKPKRKSIFSKK